jgi:secreted trypsin-like serine protease
MAIPMVPMVTIASLILSMIMTVALTGSIALLFTIGRAMPTTVPVPSIMTTTLPMQTTTTNDNNSTAKVTVESCEYNSSVIDARFTSRIVNGEAAVPNSCPWQLFLVTLNTQGIPTSICGTSLITVSHVLTAAHCVFGHSPQYVSVIPRRHGFNIASWSPDIVFMAQKIYVHESYRMITY